MYARLERTAHAVAGTLAVLGGGVLLILIALTCVSILGRALIPLDLGFGPIRGIYDLTEIGMAAAIFAFLAWTHVTQANARVDLLEPALPRRVNRLLDLLFDAAMLGVAVVGTWRLHLGMRDKLAFGETTLIAQIPVWQGYAAGLVGASAFVFIAMFCVLRSARRCAGIGQ